MITEFRTLENMAGKEYDEAKTKVFFAEDYNAHSEAINNLEENPVSVGCGCKVYSSDYQYITTGVDTPLSFDLEEYDDDNFHDLVTNNDRITIPEGKGGRYLVHAQAYFTFHASGYRRIYVKKNNSDKLCSKQIMAGGTSGSLTVDFSFITNLEDDDFLSFFVYQNSGVSLGITPNKIYTSFSVQKLS
jgi:hypothetical protein